MTENGINGVIKKGNNIRMDETGGNVRGRKSQLGKDEKDEPEGERIESRIYRCFLESSKIEKRRSDCIRRTRECIRRTRECIRRTRENERKHGKSAEFARRVLESARVEEEKKRILQKIERKVGQKGRVEKSQEEVELAKIGREELRRNCDICWNLSMMVCSGVCSFVILVFGVISFLYQIKYNYLTIMRPGINETVANDVMNLREKRYSISTTLAFFTVFIPALFVSAISFSICCWKTCETVKCSMEECLNVHLQILEARKEVESTR